MINILYITISEIILIAAGIPIVATLDKWRRELEQ